MCILFNGYLLNCIEKFCVKTDYWSVTLFIYLFYYCLFSIILLFI